MLVKIARKVVIRNLLLTLVPIVGFVLETLFLRDKPATIVVSLVLGAWFVISFQALVRGFNFLKTRTERSEIYSNNIQISLLKKYANNAKRRIQKGNPGLDQLRDLAELCLIILRSSPNKLNFIINILTECFGKTALIYFYIDYIGDTDENGEFLGISLDYEQIYKLRIL